MQDYCMQDAHIAREIAYTFFKRVYTEGYIREHNGIVGYCFPSEMYGVGYLGTVLFKGKFGNICKSTRNGISIVSMWSYGTI